MNLDRDEQLLKNASKYGATILVESLVIQGVNVHVDDDYCLRSAYEEGNPGTVKYILSLKPKIYWLTHQDEKVREIYKRIKS